MNGNKKDKENNKNNVSHSSEEESAAINSQPVDISGILNERIRNLSDAIEEIDAALARRKILNFHFLEQIERERQEAVRQLETLQPPWRAGFYPQLEFMRLSLHKSITSRAKDHRGEELKYWDDMVSLANERRKFLDEYKALMGMRRRLSDNEDR
ncbi:MAG: hypothetical protein ABR969_00745 [Sedimentisphaerales bacterium]|jgi:hypothetical protein